MKRIILTAALVAGLALAGCAVAPKDPAQAVYLIQGDYVAALTAAVKYKQLPRCGQPLAGPVCSEEKVVELLRGADDLAYAALKGAQDAVRAQPAVSAPSLEQAIASAQVAVQGFLNAVTTMGGK